MKYYKGFEVPESIESNIMVHCCGYAIDHGHCKETACGDCLYSQDETFTEWIAAGRPIDMEE
jgi:hypothetical protein